jgi:hypothetical protein
MFLIVFIPHIPVPNRTLLVGRGRKFLFSSTPPATELGVIFKLTLDAYFFLLKNRLILIFNTIRPKSNNQMLNTLQQLHIYLN